MSPALPWWGGGREGSFRPNRMNEVKNDMYNMRTTVRNSLQYSGFFLTKHIVIALVETKKKKK